MWVRAQAASSKGAVTSVPARFRADSGTNLFKQGEIVAGRLCGSVAQLARVLRRFGPQTPVGWGLTICLWLGPPWFNYWFPFTLAYRRISHEYSSFLAHLNMKCS